MLRENVAFTTGSFVSSFRDAYSVDSLAMCRAPSLPLHVPFNGRYLSTSRPISKCCDINLHLATIFCILHAVAPFPAVAATGSLVLDMLMLTCLRRTRTLYSCGGVFAQGQNEHLHGPTRREQRRKEWHRAPIDGVEVTTLISKVLPRPRFGPPREPSPDADVVAARPRQPNRGPCPPLSENANTFIALALDIRQLIIDHDDDVSQI